MLGLLASGATGRRRRRSYLEVVEARTVATRATGRRAPGPRGGAEQRRPAPRQRTAIAPSTTRGACATTSSASNLGGARPARERQLGSAAASASSKASPTEVSRAEDTTTGRPARSASPRHVMDPAERRNLEHEQVGGPGPGDGERVLRAAHGLVRRDADRADPDAPPLLPARGGAGLLDVLQAARGTVEHAQPGQRRLDVPRTVDIDPDRPARAQRVAHGLEPLDLVREALPALGDLDLGRPAAAAGCHDPADRGAVHRGDGDVDRHRGAAVRASRRRPPRAPSAAPPGQRLGVVVLHERRANSFQPAAPRPGTPSRAVRARGTGCAGRPGRRAGRAVRRRWAGSPRHRSARAHRSGHGGRPATLARMSPLPPVGVRDVRPMALARGRRVRGPDRRHLPPRGYPHLQHGRRHRAWTRRWSATRSTGRRCATRSARTRSTSLYRVPPRPEHLTPGAAAHRSNGPAPRTAAGRSARAATRDPAADGYRYTADVAVQTAEGIDPARAPGCTSSRCSASSATMPKVVVAVVDGWAAGGGYPLHVEADPSTARREHVLKQN